MPGIDRTRVRAAFHCHARDYDTHAVVQKRIVTRFGQILTSERLAPQAILDVGSGTGRLLEALAELYPAASLFGVDLAFGMSQAARERLVGTSATLVAGDGERLPFADGSFDLVVSTSTFQWLDSLQPAFREAFRVLRPGGRFVFALFGSRTLFELRECYREAFRRTGRGDERRTHRFLPPIEVHAALQSAGYDSSWVRPELEREVHPDVPALLRALRRIGAGNAAADVKITLAERRIMLSMMDLYERKYRGTDGISATYEVIYGAGLRRRSSNPPP